MLQKLWTKWKALGEFLGNLFARIVLSIFYFTIFVPFALIARLSGDPLSIKSPPPAFWQPRELTTDTLKKARGQS